MTALEMPDIIYLLTASTEPLIAFPPPGPLSYKTPVMSNNIPPTLVFVQAAIFTLHLELFPLLVLL